MLTANASHAVSISPDGKWLLYLANGQIFLRSMSEMEARPIAGKPGTDITRALAEPFFSPDSKWIGFYSREDATIKKIAITGGAAVTLCKTDSIAGASWEGDHIIFARLRDKGIMRVSENGGEPEEVVPRSGLLNTFHGPQLVNGGKSLLFTSTTVQGEDRWDRADIVLQSLKTGERKILIHGGSDAHYLPTGHLVYALGGTLFAVPLDLKKDAVQGGPIPILDGVMRAAQSNNTAAAHYAFSTNGTLVYVPGATSASSQRLLALVDRNSGKTLPLSLPPQNYLQPRFSPDGSQLVFVTQDSRDSIVWVYDLKRDKPPRRLTFEGRNAFPIWTRDGRSITFQSDRSGTRGIYQQPADGNGTAERLTTPDQGIPQIPDSWNSDGRTLLLSSANVTGGTLAGSIMTLSLDGEKKVKPLFAAPSPGVSQFNAAFSPDGRWFAYSSFENIGLATPRIFVEPFPPTGSKYELPDGGLGPVWSATGKQLLYQVIGGNRLSAVDVQTAPAFTFGRSTSITIEGLVPVANPTLRSFDISPDGKQFVVVLDSTATQTVKQPNPQINVVLNWFTELQRRVPVK
jgi:Tol biopolymer transport system component